MRVQIAARHCDVPDSVRERTETQLSKLQKYDPRLSSANVTYLEEKLHRRIEVILSIHGGPAVVASAHGEEFRTALDKVVDRLGRKLRRSRSQVRDHQAPRLSEEVISD